MKSLELADTQANRPGCESAQKPRRGHGIACLDSGDLLVTCSATDATNPKIKSEPLLVVDVRSPSTAAYDRDDKFGAYRTLPSLQEYLLVDPDRRRCDLFRKGGDGLWVLHPFERGTPVQLDSVQFTLSAERLWEDLDPPQVGDATLA